MLSELLSGMLTPGDFEIQFMTRWGDDERWIHDDAFAVLEEFAFVVEDYVDNPSLREPANGDLGPDELKAKARELLQRAGFEPPSTE